MVVGYTYGDGSIHKKIKIFGAEAYQKASNSAMIICNRCGLVVKTYALDPQKL